MPPSCSLSATAAVRHTLIASFLLLLVATTSVKGVSAAGKERHLRFAEQEPDQHNDKPKGGDRSRRPHVVFILADDLGWSDIGYINRRFDNVMRSPHLDELAAQGVKLSNYYVQSLCSPSRAALLTGKYTIHTGLQHGIVQSAQMSGLGTEHATIAEVLKPLGYSTHMVGKWHLGYYKKELTPLHRGFDSFFGFYNGAETHFTHWSRCDFPGWLCEGENECWGLDFWDNDQPYDPAGDYSTDLLTRRAVDIITAHDTATPLFLYLPYQAVHLPLEAPEESINKFSHIQDRNRRIYAAMLQRLDEGVANVTQALKDAGMYEDTVIIFSSDNGADVSWGGSSWPLRGWKGSYWEGGIRSTAFVHSPLLQQTGVTRHGLFHITDWLPTILRLATTPLGDDMSERWLPSRRQVLQRAGQVDGLDQWDMISTGAPSPRTEVLLNIDPVGRDRDPWGGTQQSAIRVGAYKLLVGNPGQNLQHDGWIPPPDFKHPPATVRPGCQPCRFDWANMTTGLCLFDVENDPTERCNLAASRPHIVERLLSRLQAYNATAVPATFAPPSQYCNPQLYGGHFDSFGDIWNLP